MAATGLLWACERTPAVALADACVTEWRPKALRTRLKLLTLHSLMLVLLNGGNLYSPAGGIVSGCTR